MCQHFFLRQPVEMPVHVGEQHDIVPARQGPFDNIRPVQQNMFFHPHLIRLPAGRRHDIRSMNPRAHVARPQHRRGEQKTRRLACHRASDIDIRTALSFLLHEELPDPAEYRFDPDAVRRGVELERPVDRAVNPFQVTLSQAGIAAQKIIQQQEGQGLKAIDYFFRSHFVFRQILFHVFGNGRPDGRKHVPGEFRRDPGPHRNTHPLDFRQQLPQPGGRLRSQRVHPLPTPPVHAVNAREHGPGGIVGRAGHLAQHANALIHIGGGQRNRCRLVTGRLFEQSVLPQLRWKPDHTAQFLGAGNHNVLLVE